MKDRAPDEALPVRSPMTTLGLIHEIRGALRGQRVAFAAICLLVAGMCATVVLTAGRAQAAANAVAQQIDAAGSRQLAITAKDSAALVSPTDVTVLAGAQGVRAVIGVGTSHDVTVGSVGAGGTPVAAQAVVGDLKSVVILTSGRWPRIGEAIVVKQAQRSLGLDEPAGWVTDNHGQDAAIVGSYVPRPGFDDLAGVLIAGDSGIFPTLRIELSDIAAASVVQQLAMTVLNPPDAGLLTVTSPTGLARLQQSVGVDLASNTKAVTAIALSSGIVLIVIIVLSQVLLQRRDIGRRRALGAPRWAVVALVLGQTVIPAAVGAIIGAVIATAITYRIGAGPEVTLPIAAATLSVLAAVLAAIPPAVIAAWRDPVRVLRTA